MPNITVLHAAATVGSSTTLTSGSASLISVVGSSFVDGHRYLLLFKATVGADAGTSKIEILQGGVVITNSEGQRSAPTPPAHWKQISGMDVIVGDSTQSVEMRLVWIAGTAQSANEQLLLIDLDSGLVEDQDWFFDSNPTSETPGTSFGSEVNPAEIIFTPDGSSDYLVIGDIRWSGGGALTNDSFRVYDATGASELVKEGQGSGNLGPEFPHYGVLAVLASPPASARTIRTQYKQIGGILKKQESRLFILRLQAFSSAAWASQDVNAAWSGSRQSVGSFLYTPDDAGIVVVLADLKAAITSGFDSGNGLLGDIEYDGVVISDIDPDLGRWVSASYNANFDLPALDDTMIGPSFFDLVADASEQVIVEAFVEANTTSSSAVILRYMTLVAFGTDVVEAPASLPTQDYEDFSQGWADTAEIKTEFAGAPRVFGPDDKTVEDFESLEATVSVDVHLSAVGEQQQASLNMMIT